MSKHELWTYPHFRVGKKKCQRLTIEGKICNRPLGTCIHNWKPTLFGARPQA